MKLRLHLTYIHNIELIVFNEQCRYKKKTSLTIPAHPVQDHCIQEAVCRGHLAHTASVGQTLTQANTMNHLETPVDLTGVWGGGDW